MISFRLTASRYGFAFSVLLLFGSAVAADSFPFDQTLVLEDKPMPPVKRMPLLIVEPNGDATIGLWCKTVRGRVDVTDSEIHIESNPLPEVLPQYMASGQCTDERMKADQDTLDALKQVTGWRRKGNAIVLNGAQAMKFRPSDN
ncbi:MAG TPA: hypothetical protein VEJ40_03650 [Pseudolabrys sp.]|nr:hypothetical protein [Pseudolabrys sp.]